MTQSKFAARVREILGSGKSDKEQVEELRKLKKQLGSALFKEYFLFSTTATYEDELWYKVSSKLGYLIVDTFSKKGK